MYAKMNGKTVCCGLCQSFSAQPERLGRSKRFFLFCYLLSVVGLCFAPSPFESDICRSRKCCGRAWSVWDSASDTFALIRVRGYNSPE